MPKYGIHQIVLSEATVKLGATADPAGQLAAGALNDRPAYANLGAVGPDLFFWAPDYEIVDKLYTLYENIDELVQIYESIVGPVKDMVNALGEPVQETVETLTPSTVALLETLLAEVRETADAFSAMVQTGIFAGVVEGANLITDAADIPSLAAAVFQEFKPPLQDGKAEPDWYWFDMLHYRRTGDFGRQLVANGLGGTLEQRAYCLGYLSHVATDLVGHAYVNQVVGGPYRLHVQRHVTVENFMDTWKWDQHYGENINLHLFTRMGLEPTLHASVRDLLHQTFQQVYNDPAKRPGGPGALGDDGGFLSPGQIEETYDVFYKILELMQSQSVDRPEEPFGNVADILEQALKDLLEPPPTPPGLPAGKCSPWDILAFGLTEQSRECYEEFFEQLAEWFEFLGQLLGWLLETLFDLLDLLLALLLSLPIAVILALLYAIQMICYTIYSALRSVLALEGFLFPEPGDLETSHGQFLITPALCGLHGCRSVTSGGVDTPAHLYPRLTSLTTSHLVCPPGPAEATRTVPSFDSASNVTPDAFIHQTPLSLGALRAFAASESVAATRALWAKCPKIGNATDLTAWMIGVAADANASPQDRDTAFANWNLDSDRGYAYKTWDGNLPGNSSTAVGEGYDEP